MNSKAISRGMAPKEIPELNRLGEIVHLIAMFPVNPDILQRNPAFEVVSFQSPQCAAEINRVLREAALKPSPPGTAGVKMRGMRGQRLDARIWNADAREMGVVQREAKAGHQRRELPRPFGGADN